MAYGYAVVIEQLGSLGRWCDPDRAYDSKARSEFAGGDPPLLVHRNRARPFAALITLAIVGGMCPARFCCAQATQQACTLRIHVDGLGNRKGVVGALVFTSAVGWPEDVHKSFRHQYAPVAATGRGATVVMKDLPPGNYGIVVLHDENENMKLDRNIFGFPKEGFGFANNPNVGLRAPPFMSAVMNVACPATDTTIHIIYK
jgi:uncharacterized protein (DUF2141 family)